MKPGRVRGCLIGGAVGDALGAPVEFDSLGRIRAHYGPGGITDLTDGLVTDDTQMTLFTVEGLIRGSVRDRERGHVHVPSVVRHAYLRWLDTQDHPAPPDPGDLLHRTGWLREQTWLYARRAPGNACLSGLRGQVNADSKGCGTVMRSAPFGLGPWPVGQAYAWAAECSRLTHGHPTAAASAGALAAIVHHLVNDTTLENAVAATLPLIDDDATADALRAAVALAHTGPPSPEKVESLGEAWVAEEALAIGVYCALVGGSFTEGLVLAVNHSGDSDSTGSVCGNLLGAEGVRIPAAWIDRVEGRDTIERLADDFVSEMTAGGAPGDRYPGH
ncbi:ADP-ribosylglycohydrolase family protein [Herbidospora sp. NEAU-GS84]|uniref:ADP-ribosylglycohydrolase family protein n=1 Tax=Herbidospora solisilvae TaxID=2696284 RepID=A0A7C9J4K0_9ACTN|nr:ADP-ribosylglycohydrolase family protein [Herbidospora solisilvae]NAS24285.1 ADP-ribosylglycohydrolase family protein [Herbidospora solisilvae]